MKRTLLIAVVSALIGSAATFAYADKQPHMKQAKQHLEKALEQLKSATADKGGHRVKAIEHVEAAIAQVKEGIEHDNKH